ncbi:MAG: signal peptidase II, partial [bacterium]
MLKYLWLSLLCVIADQVTKVWVQAELTLYERVPVWPFFNLTLVYNEGAAFSFLGDASGWQRWFFISVAVVVSTVMIIWLSRLTVAERLVALALSLVIGGAIGNLIDRVVYGHVVDFNLKTLQEKDIPFLRRKLGIVFQDFKLLSDRNINNNLKFVLKATGWTDA